MYKLDPEFLTAVDAAVRSSTISKSQVFELDDALDNRASLLHTHQLNDIAGLETLIDDHLRNCTISMNQVDGLHNAIDGALVVRDHIKHIVPEVQGSYIPVRVLTIEVPPAAVSFLHVSVIGYDVETGDTFSTTMGATVKNFNGKVSIVGDTKYATPVADQAVSGWRSILVSSNAVKCKGITVLVQSDSRKRVTWKIIADLT